jgi:general secretion pathway protein A
MAPVAGETIASMYEAHWGLSQAPFQNVPDPAFFCPLPAHQDALERLLYIVQHGKGGAVLTAGAGCGKSTLSRVLLSQLQEEKYDVGFVINPSFSAAQVLYEIVLQLDLSPPSSDRAALFRLLNDHLLANAREDRTTVLIVDEAHMISDDATFEDLRLLLNVQLNDRHLLCLILTGLPEFGATLERFRPFRQRLAFFLNLNPLTAQETASYITFRLKKGGASGRIFTDEAMRAIHEETAGTPRDINKLCDLCLYEGWKRKTGEIDASFVRLVTTSDGSAQR